jgi:hypothetical protein
VVFIMATGCGHTAPRQESKTRTATVLETRREAGSPPRRLPEWLRRYCREVARVARRPLLCFGTLPVRLSPTENARVLRPGPTGYVAEATGGAHWAFAAQIGARSIVRQYGSARRLGHTTVRGQAGDWFLAGRRSGLFAGHLVLEWHEAGATYAISVHTRRPTREGSSVRRRRRDDPIRPQRLAASRADGAVARLGVTGSYARQNRPGRKQPSPAPVPGPSSRSASAPGGPGVVERCRSVPVIARRNARRRRSGRGRCCGV